MKAEKYLLIAILLIFYSVFLSVLFLESKENQRALYIGKITETFEVNGQFMVRLKPLSENELIDQVPLFRSEGELLNLTKEITIKFVGTNQEISGRNFKNSQERYSLGFSPQVGDIILVDIEEQPNMTDYEVTEIILVR